MHSSSSLFSIGFFEVFFWGHVLTAAIRGIWVPDSVPIVVIDMRSEDKWVESANGFLSTSS